MKQLPFAIGWILLTTVLISAGCSPQSNTNTDTAKYDVGIIVMDHMVESMEVMQQSLNERGYTEGDNITYHVYEFFDEDSGSTESLQLPSPETVATFDVIIALEAGDNEDEPLGIAAELANNTTPIVFIADNNFPIEAGFVDSMIKPGKNVTGVLQGLADDRRFELFHQMLPDARRILVPYDPDEPDTENAIKDITQQAEEVGVELVPVATADYAAYVAGYSGDIDAIFVVRASEVEQWSAFALEHNLPLSSDESYEETPFAVMAYVQDEADMSRKAAALVVQILNGANPGDLPLEQATFLLSINLVNAEKTGISISDNFLEQANEIIRTAEE